jgi:hypothetical protein
VSLDDALRAPLRLLVRRAGALLPVYLLAASAPGVARVPLFVALAVAVAALAAGGRLDPLFDALREVDLRALAESNGTGGGVDPATAAARGDAVSALATPLVVGLLVVGGLLAAVVGVVASGVASAGTLAAVDAGLRREDPLLAGVRGLGRHWRALVVLAVGRALVYLALGAVALVAVAAAASVGGAAAVVVGGLGLVLALPVVVAVELLVGFAGPAVVVDGTGAAEAVRRAARLALDRPGAYVVLLLAGGVLAVGVGVAAGLAAVAGVGRVVGLVTTLVVAPLFDGLRVALYADRPPADDGADDDPTAVLGRSSPGARLLAVPREGLVALGRFVREHPGANAGGAVLLAAGFAVGWALVAPYGVGVRPPGDVGNVFGAVPVGPFLNIAANNWLVAAAAAYGGAVAGVPTVVALGFNGVLLGVVAGVTESTAFLALVGPHATLELPAIAVAGGLGLHLGRVGVDAVRGRESAAGVARALDETFRALLGLGVVFIVAAGVEAFVTPAVAAAVLG